MNKYPLVSVITINYNEVDATLDLLESISKVTYPNLEVIVVDNASRENPKNKIEKKFPHVKLILSDKNLGFAGGNNLAIKNSTGDFILFLNNDTVVDPGFLLPLINVLRHPSVGLVSPKIKYHNSNLLQYAGSSTLCKLTGRSKRFGFKEEDNGQFDIKKETGLAHGAAMMTKKSVINDIGLMSEEYFLYYEEVDWCYKIKKAGYKIWFIPKSTVYHKASLSTNKLSSLKTFYMNRNRILFMRKHSKGIYKYLWPIFYLIATFPKTFLQNIHNMDLLKTYIKSILWNFKNSVKK